MRKIRLAITVVRYTVIEGVHNKVFLFGASLFATTLAAGYFFTSLMIGSRLKVLLDYALFSYQLFVFGFVFFFVIPYLSKPERCKTISLFLTTQLDRSTFVVGLFSGFIALLASTGLFFFGATIAVLRIACGIWAQHLFLGFIAIFVEGVFLAAAGLLFSLLLPGLLAWGAVAAAYLIGYLSHDWLMLVVKKSGPLAAIFAQSTSYLLPDLAALDIKSFVIQQIPFSAFTFGLAIVHTACITGMATIASLVLFNKKKF